MKLSYKYHTFNIPLCLLRHMKRRMKWVRAAGGIVTAPDGTMLLIQRNGRWDLPKGKVESGETLLQAALREVEEETGIKNICPLTPSHSLSLPFTPIKTYHIFNLYGGWHLKQTSWFPMSAEKQPVTPQQEEGITDVVWVTPDEWHRRLSSSYGTLKTLEKQIR
jgi:8-oxo-dGTP pyrophosphatase MutT (NUDIX family)